MVGGSLYGYNTAAARQRRTLYKHNFKIHHGMTERLSISTIGLMDLLVLLMFLGNTCFIMKTIRFFAGFWFILPNASPCEPRLSIQWNLCYRRYLDSNISSHIVSHSAIIIVKMFDRMKDYQITPDTIDRTGESRIQSTFEIILNNWIEFVGPDFNMNLKIGGRLAYVFLGIIFRFFRESTRRP